MSPERKHKAVKLTADLRFRWQAGMFIRWGALEMRLNERDAEECNAGENPWHPWKQEGPFWPDYADGETAQLLDSLVPGWRAAVR